MSHLLQDDLRTIIAREKAGWTINDSGVVPAFGKSPPRSIFFIVESRPKHYDDYVWRQKHQGGKFYRIELEIHLGIDPEKQSIKPWAIKYRNAAHIKCKVLRGDDGYEHRYSSRGTNVCSGVFGLLDIPDAAMPIAEKIRKVMNSHMATQAEIQPF